MSAVRLLILDDDPAIGQTMQFIAESAGMSARFTARHAEFFLAVDEWNPTHIALDLVMPEMDGVQVLVGLADRQCRARIIITSGVGSRVLDAAGRSAAEHGLSIAGVLSKPFSPKALRALLREDASLAEFEARPAPAAAPAAEFEITPDQLRRALERRELRVYYQPKVACVSGMLAGFEALVRWQHPQRGLIMPDRFVPLAEANGLIDALTDQVLANALDWMNIHFPPAAATSICLSLNISARTLKDMAFVDRITAACAARGVDPARIIFELTETSAMEDPVTSLDLLTRLRMKGFQLSIDDFGTGFSSMLQLVRLPFSEIKVDKSFVMSATTSQESRTVVKSVVDLGHSLGLRATAEGVENAETLQYLREIGCDLAQGYFIARPMPGEAVPGWIAAHGV